MSWFDHDRSGSLVLNTAGRVSGSVAIRPIRLGLVIDPNSHAGLRRAIQCASLCWGGRTFPIFTSDEDPDEIRRISILLGLDALIACDDQADDGSLTRVDGYSWRGYRTPFDLDNDAQRLVDLRTVLVAMRRAGTSLPDVPRQVLWHDDDPLAPVLRVMFGELSSDTKYEEDVCAQVDADLTTVRVDRGSPLPAALSLGDGVLGLGMWGVWHRHVWGWQAGAAVVDQTAVHDLVRFWNLRALGHLIVPCPKTDEVRLANWSSAHLQTLPLGRWGQEPGHLSAFTDERDAPERLLELLRQHSDDNRVIVSFLDLEPHCHHGSQLETDIRGYFDVGVQGGAREEAPSIRVPMPRSDLLPDQPGVNGWQFCAARVTIHSEQGIGERRGFRAPAIRRLSSSHGWNMALHAPIVRGVGDGVVIGCKVDNETLSIGAIDSVELISRLLRDAGFVTKVGDAGRWSSRIIDLFGGAASVLASQPAVREILDLAARPSGANQHELRSAAAREKGIWADPSIFWSRDTPYERWVVGTLAARRILEAVLEYDCPACGLANLIPADRLGTHVKCDSCEHESPLSLQLVLGASWRLRTRKLIDQLRLRSVLPIASTLRLLLDLSRDSDSLHYALGLELAKDGREFEIDYAALVHDDRGAALVVGESKARNSLEDDDVSNLETVQDAVRALGVECFIAISSSKDQLAETEVSRLRASAERFVFGLDDTRGRASYVALPIVLTKRSLTVPSESADHPLRATNNYQRELNQLAWWTNQQELGLVGYGDPMQRTLTWNLSPSDAPSNA